MKYFYLSLLTFLFSQSILQAQNFKVVGYLPHYRFSLADKIEFEKITHLNLSFLNPDIQGNLSIGGQDIAPIIQKAKAKNPDIEVFISLAGGGMTPEWEAAYDKFLQPNERSGFIHLLIEYLELYNLDGIDVDLEWNMVNALYSPFVLELKDSLDAHSIQMSAAWPATYRYPDISNQALAAFDFINLMAYDLTGSWAPNNPGPHSPYSFAQQGITYWKNQGVNGNRMTLGVPFYGYDFTTQSVTSFTFGSMVAEDTTYALLDEVGQKFYNGIPTIEAKTLLALNEVAGIMIWELGQDAFDGYADFSLLRTIEETLDEQTQSIGNDLEQLNAQFFPNPFSDILTLRYEGTPLEVEIVITDLQGRTIIQNTSFLTSEGSTLDVSHLSSGMYVAIIRNRDRFFQQKIIKR